MLFRSGTSISGLDILKASGRPFISALVAAGVTFGLQLLYGSSLSPFPRLLLGGGLLLIVYLWMLLYVMRQKEFYIDLLQSLRSNMSVGKKQSVVVPGPS